MRYPSSGGKGRRLKIAKLTLSRANIFQNEKMRSLSKALIVTHQAKIYNCTMIMPAQAKSMFVAGHASATSNSSLRGFL